MKRLELKDGDVVGNNGLIYIKEVEPYIEPSGRKRRCCVFICHCGNQFKQRLGDVIMNKTISCGCKKINRTNELHKNNTKHGKTKTPEYTAWNNMRKRCYNPKIKQYKDYGGRGIIMCDEWKDDFTQFLLDVGKRPSPELSIDRINNDLGYFKYNVRWATRKEQNNNQRRIKKIT